MANQPPCSDPKTKSKSKAPDPAPPTLFGQPQLLEGEDAAAYDELLARIYAAIKPTNVIEEMFIADVISLTWEVLRWRRLKLSLIRTHELAALEDFVGENLDYALYSKAFASHLAEILQEGLPQDQAKALAQKCAANEAAAVDRVSMILNAGDSIDSILQRAQALKAKELVQGHAQRDPDAVTLVDGLLADNGMSLDALVANRLSDCLDQIERIDRLTTIAEDRRNDALREIDRRRAVLAEALRWSVQQVEHGESNANTTKLIKGSDAA